MEFPTCPKCDTLSLVPLSDYGMDGAAVQYKAWACLSKNCGFVIHIDKGVVFWHNKIPGGVDVIHRRREG